MPISSSPCPAWNPPGERRGMAEKWTLWTNFLLPSGLSGVKQGPCTFLSLSQGALCSKTLIKTFAWAGSNHHIYLKELMEKLARFFFVFFFLRDLPIRIPAQVILRVDQGTHPDVCRRPARSRPVC